MNNIIFASNKALYLILIFSLFPVIVATVIGLIVGLFQTITQLQEHTLPFGLKLIGVMGCLYLLSGWYSEVLLSYAHEVIKLALS